MLKKDLFKRLACFILAAAMLFAVAGCEDSKPVISDDTFYDEYYDEGTDLSSDVASDEEGDIDKEGGKSSETSSGNKTDKNSSDNKTSANKDSSNNQNNTSNKVDTNNQNNTSSNVDSGDANDITQNVDNKDKFKGKTVKMLFNWDVNKNSFEKNAIDNIKKDLGITVKPIVTTQELYQTKLTSMIASNDSPDVCFMDETDFPTMILKNKIVPIDTSILDIEKDTELSLPVMDIFKWDGKYYGIACPGTWQGGPYVIIYNKTAIVQKGYKTPLELYRAGNWNWDTFAELAKNMTDKSKNFYGFGCADDVLTAFLSSIKTDFVRLDGTKIKNNLDDANLTKALTFLSELRKNGYMNPENNGGKSTARAMSLYSTWVLQKAHYKNAVGTENIEIVPVPSPKGQTPVTAYDARVFCIARGAKNPEAAHYAMRYFVDPDNYDMENDIEVKQAREMFFELSKSKNVYAGIGQGVASYNNSEDFWGLLWLTRESPEDIPVKLQAKKSVIDGIISKIESDIKLFN